MSGEFHCLPYANAKAFEMTCSEVISIQYLLDIKNKKARKEYKKKCLMDNPETLFADCYKTGKVSNLIHWHSAILTHYPAIKEVLAMGGNSRY